MSPKVTLDALNAMDRECFVAADGTPLASAMKRAESPDRLLAALVTQGGAESVREVWVRGRALVL